MDIIHELRMGKFDTLIGINLLREGLDIPEVSLVAILDADKEGFLRSARSLIQTCGRAARNIRGKVIMYADEITRSMQQAIDETTRRRKIQRRYNDHHGITPESIEKEITSVFAAMVKVDNQRGEKISESVAEFKSFEDLDDILRNLEKEMNAAAKELAFEKAAELRDQINQLQKFAVFEL
jgi:excinuclease ABC subunit B